jgi:hypothetical protein
MIHKQKEKDDVELLERVYKTARKQWREYPAIKHKYNRYLAYKKKLDDAIEKAQAEERKIFEQKIRQQHIEFNPSVPLKVSDLKGYAKRIKYNFNTSKAMLINMELSNGDHTQFIAYPQKERFEYNKKMYIIDHQFKYYVHSAKMFCLDYHEDFVLPVKRRIPIDLMRKATASQGVTDIENATNPSTLKRFIESEIIEKVMKGQEFEDALKFIKFVVIVGAIVGVVHLIIFVSKSGMLTSIGVG